jgi:hypothetical protein
MRYRVYATSVKPESDIGVREYCSTDSPTIADAAFAEAAAMLGPTLVAIFVEDGRVTKVKKGGK